MKINRKLKFTVKSSTIYGQLQYVHEAEVETLSNYSSARQITWKSCSFRLIKNEKT